MKFLHLFQIQIIRNITNPTAANLSQDNFLVSTSEERYIEKEIFFSSNRRNELM